MSSKESILDRLGKAVVNKYDMPSFDDINPLAYPDPAAKFIETSALMGANVVEASPEDDLRDIVRKAYPDAATFCSNLKEMQGLATSNPDDVADATSLNGTDVGIIRGSFGVAENGCIWIEQTMKERAVCFISENLVIILRRDGNIVSNMHEAYARVSFNDNGYGVFISGPSKTADIAQVLVLGAQAARSVTVILT